jgi:Tol biopolymer transport system component
MRRAVAPDGTPAGEPEPLITGYHQDLTPSISADGRWLAWHSRRSATPVPYYAGPGVADDVFVRAADDPDAPERRISEDGWEVGNPSWGPDGRLIFDTWERGGVPSFSRPWIATIDGGTGEPLASERLQLPDELGGSVSAVWSPIADELLLIERRDPGSQTLWLMSLSRASVERLVDFASRTLGGASFTPDGSAVVYAALADGRMQLYEISRTGGEPRRLTDVAAGLMHPSVSPDGRWIAATKLVQQKELRRVPLAALR